MEAGNSIDLFDLATLRSAQNKLSWERRDLMAQAMAVLATERAADFKGGRDADRLAPLLAKGICDAPQQAAPRTCEEVRSYFQGTPCYSAHVPAQSDGVARSVDEAAARSNYGSYTLEQNLRAPHLVELALDPALLDLAGGYLGCVPSLYSVNTFWTFPRPSAGLTHQYHRDNDDFRFVVVFFYWTDVEVGEGEFYFMEGTHDRQAVEKQIRYSPWRLIDNTRERFAVHSAEELRHLGEGSGYGFDDLYRSLFGADIRCVEGKAGTAIVTDTFGLHSGAPPRSRRRLCTWIRYGLYANTAYRDDKTAPVPASAVRGRVPDDPLTRHVTRLVLDWNR